MLNFKMTEHSIRMSGKRTWGALLGAIVLLGVTSASASPEFPAELKEAAGMDCKPACTICHTTNPGSAGTADQSFAIAMVDAGLLPGKPDTVAKAFDNLGDVDSDGDETSDVDELTAEGASDPSAPGVGAPCAAEVRYGCAAGAESSAPRNLGTLLWPLLLAAVGLGVWARRRTIASPER
jgi:MYXO-CTERM domain-containing protein